MCTISRKKPRLHDNGSFFIEFPSSKYQWDRRTTQHVIRHMHALEVHVFRLVNRTFQEHADTSPKRAVKTFTVLKFVFIPSSVAHWTKTSKVHNLRNRSVVKKIPIQTQLYKVVSLTNMLCNNSGIYIRFDGGTRRVTLIGYFKDKTLLSKPALVGKYATTYASGICPNFMIKLIGRKIVVEKRLNITWNTEQTTSIELL